MLTQFPQLADDSIAVIWTMVERHDEDSQWAPFWESLPPKLHSGLSLSDGLVQALQGISAHAEIVNSQQVLLQKCHKKRYDLCLSAIACSGMCSDRKDGVDPACL